MIPHPSHAIANLLVQTSCWSSPLAMKRGAKKEQGSHREEIGDRITEKGDALSQAVQHTAQGGTKHGGGSLSGGVLSNGHRKLLARDHRQQPCGLGQIEGHEQTALDEGIQGKLKAREMAYSEGKGNAQQIECTAGVAQQHHAFGVPTINEGSQRQTEEEVWYLMQRSNPSRQRKRMRCFPDQE